ncbi:MAG: hypothetical protein RLO81_13715 [Fulvivirga sp.]|uniref:hypothetical protein n=1 Tax=Fulvivirga sp. TaxID=1931237 RepID=UPI0032EABDFB
MKKLLLIAFFSLTTLTQEALAQCAMCRATVENNLSNGDIGIGAGLNFGILYLFVMPYLAVGIIGFLWYRHSKANSKKYGSV